MAKCQAVCMLCCVGTTLVMPFTWGTDPTTVPTDFKTSPVESNEIETTSNNLSAIRHTTQSSESSGHTSQTFHTTNTQSFSESSLKHSDSANNTELPHNVTHNITECVQNPLTNITTIQATNGHVFFQSSNQNHYGHCTVKIMVPAGHIVRFQIKKCKFVSLGLFDLEQRKEKRFMRSGCRSELDTALIYSQTHRVLVKLFPDLPQASQEERAKLSIYFIAVNKSERPSLEVIHLTPKSGFLQTSALNNSTFYPPFMQSCVSLTVPTDHVLFVGFLSMDVHHNLRVFPGPCHSLTNTHNHCWSPHGPWLSTEPKCFTEDHYPDALLYPDDFNTEGQGKQHDHLSFHFSSTVFTQMTGFKLRFSLHTSKLKPKRVERLKGRDYGVPTQSSQWNCSVSLWPELFLHFPCDLVAQCAQAEDEARCPYVSQKCGRNKIQAGERCYIYKKQKYVSWFDAEKKCLQRGAILASLETHQEWRDVTSVLRNAVSTSTWVGLKTARKNARGKFMRAL